MELGPGQAVFERAKRALSKWRQFDLGWLEAFPEDTPIRVGETVFVLARAVACGGPMRPGLCMPWMRVRRLLAVWLCVWDVAGHVERGEERFLIEWDRASDVVSFDILAFSRPKHYLVRLNSRRARTMQKRFAVESTAAMKRYVTEERANLEIRLH